ncbi:MAG: hypothetical protein ACE5MB_03745 [Anaerolineae bacterium]
MVRLGGKIRLLLSGWLLLGLGAVATLGGCGSPPDFPSPVVEASHLGRSSDFAEVVMAYVEGRRGDDPLVQLDENVWVKSSNYYGVRIDGVVYYYCLLPHASFDPLSRGEVDREAVRVRKVISEPEFTIIIYTINRYEEHRI